LENTVDIDGRCQFTYGELLSIVDGRKNRDNFVDFIDDTCANLRIKKPQNLVKFGKSFMSTDVHTLFKLLMDNKVEMADYSKKRDFF